MGDAPLRPRLRAEPEPPPEGAGLMAGETSSVRLNSVFRVFFSARAGCVDCAIVQFVEQTRAWNPDSAFAHTPDRIYSIEPGNVGVGLTRLGDPGSMLVHGWL